jgi:solute carrier family 25 (mitochondrial carnitine/acylcarnitine transporter), member 20/29
VHRFSTVEDGRLSIAQTSAAGFFSAVPMTAITAPFERVKVLLQIQGQQQLAPGEKPKYSGGVDVVRQLYKGVRRLWQEMGLAARRISLLMSISSGG